MPIDIEDDELEGLTDEEKDARRKAIGAPIGTGQPNLPAPRTMNAEAPTIGGPPASVPQEIGTSPRPGPAEPKPRIETLGGIGGKILRPLEAIGSAIAPGPLSRIPGTHLHQQAEIDKDLARRFETARTTEQGALSEEALARGREADARAWALKNPQAQAGKTPEEQFMVDALHGGPNGGPKNDAQGKPYTYLSAHEAWKEAEQVKPPRDMTAKPGVLNGRPAWGVQTEKGWIDPETRELLHGFSPQPTFAETGLYEQTSAFDPKSGQMVPARFDKRSGTIVGYGGETHLIPIGPEATKMIGTNLEGAREADTRLETMTQNYQDGLKGNQQAMLSLLANHIGMTLGLQKGARITQTIYDEAQATAPIIGRIAAHFDKNGYLTGVVLTPEQMKQMMELAEQKRGYLWTQAEQAGRTYGIPLQTEGLRKKVGTTAEGGGKGGTVHYVEGNDEYDIPSDKIAAFEKKHPNAKRQ